MSEIPKATPHATFDRAMDEISGLLDVPFRITIQLGRRSMKVREILQLRQNSIVEIPKSAGENLDVLINGRLVAYGEVLEMEGSAGIRLTDLHPHS